MLFIIGTMTMTPDVLDDFARDIAEMRPKVLAEAGCQHYSLLVEDKAAGIVNVVEGWSDDAALGVHLAQPWVVEFSRKYMPHVLAHSLAIHDVAGQPRPLPGM